MAASFFADKTAPPNPDMVAAALAESCPLWTELWEHVRQNYPDVAGEWKHYGKSSGWTFPVKSKKRTMFYFVPKDGCFAVHFTFGDRAAAVIEASSLPRTIIDELLAARKYMEGRPVALSIVDAQQLESAKQLLKIKYEN